MSDIDSIADRLLERAGDVADETVVTVSRGNLALTRFANSHIHQNVAEEFVGISLKTIIDGRVGIGSTNRHDDESLDTLVARTADAARHQPPDHEWPGVAPPAPMGDPGHHDPATAAASPTQRATIVSEFVHAGAAAGSLAAGYCDSSFLETVVVNSAGLRAHGRSTRATVDGIHQLSGVAGSAHQTASSVDELDGSAVGAIAVDRAVRGIDPFDTKPGDYEVVLAPEAVATIAVFLAGYGFNAKTVIEDQSFVELDDRQFDESFSMWDDVFDPRAVGVGFDAEGTPKRRVDLVEAGVSVGLAHDRRTAHRLGAESTGHAVPGGETFGAFPANLIVATGDATEDELIADVDRGLYVSTFNYCRILDPKSQIVTGLTRNGTFMIESGRLTDPVTNLRFTQSFLDALGHGRVLGVGNVARMADSEFGPGIVVAPPMRLAQWHFTGGVDG